MGSALVALALGVPGITPRARCVLARMALTAHDGDSPPIYWAGWPMLGTHGLGYDTYENAAELAVKRAIRELLDAGLIKVVRPGGRGVQAEYALSIPMR